MLKLLSESWNGEASLAKAFWLTYVLFSLLCGLIIALILTLFTPDFMSSSSLYSKLHFHKDWAKTLGFPYTFFSAVCVWRCAKNSSRLWRIIARVFVIFGVLSALLSIFLLMIHYLQAIR